MKRSISYPLFATFLLAACGGGTTTPDGLDTTCDTGAATVTMTQLQTLIDAKCKSCHLPPDGSGYAYGDYSSVAKTYEMVGKKSLYAGSAGTLKIVEPNNLANSSLWLKCSAKTSAGFKSPDGKATGAKMPNDGNTLTAAELKQIKDFICTGAKQN